MQGWGRNICLLYLENGFEIFLGGLSGTAQMNVFHLEDG